MFAASKSGSAVEATDPQFNYVTMLLHGDGTNGAQNNTFLDSSTNNFTITRNGNTTQGTFTPYGSNWSNYFDGSSSLSISSANTVLPTGTQDFSVELFVNWQTQSGSYPQIISNPTTSGFQIYYDVSAGALAVGIFNVANVITYTIAQSALVGVWTHIAVTRSGTTFRLFVNGILQANGINVISFASPTTQYIASDGSRPYTGYISNVRTVLGSIPTAYQTSSTTNGTSVFTPSTTPLTAISGTALLTCQSNRFIDNSTNAFALTANGTPSVQRFSPFSPTSAYSTSVIGGSGYFDGSGDYLNVASQTALGMGSGDFTYEAWIYVNEVVPTDDLRGLFDSRVSGATGCGIYTSADAGTTSKLVYTTNSAIVASSTNTIKAYAWTHVAVTRSGTTVRGFLNGAVEFTYTDSRTFSSSAATYIGTDTSPRYFNGFINDVRILKGTAQYTSAFTPSTAPLTAITNTSLLLNYTNAGILDNAMMNDLETVGNAQISTSVKKYGTGSLAFDGTGDRLVNLASSPRFSLANSDHTIEMWIYANSFSGFPYLVTNASSGTSSVNWTMYLTTGGALGWGANNGPYQFSGGSISLSTWTHVAICQSGSNVYYFVNGSLVLTKTKTDVNNASWVATSTISVGSQYGSNDYNGYIDDLRITNYARYTATFTPPTTAFADKG